MALLTTRVPRALETKTKLYGFELSDLLVIFLYLSISNFLFGSTSLKFVIVWLGTTVIAVTLRISKKGKPDNFLQHLGEYSRLPDVFSASCPDTDYQPYPKVSEKIN